MKRKINATGWRRFYTTGGSCFCDGSKRDAHSTTISSLRSSYCHQITFHELSSLPALFSAINRNGTRREKKRRKRERQWCDNAPAERANRYRRTCGAKLGQITWVEVNKLAVSWKPDVYAYTQLRWWIFRQQSACFLVRLCLLPYHSVTLLICMAMFHSANWHW
jgi:hypothetical protein